MTYENPEGGEVLMDFGAEIIAAYGEMGSACNH